MKDTPARLQHPDPMPQAGAVPQPSGPPPGGPAGAPLRDVRGWPAHGSFPWSRHRPSSVHPLRVALLAPPWLPVPPPGYGGIEAVLEQLAAGLVRRGHEVTLLAAPGSHSPAAVVTLLEAPQPRKIGQTLYEIDHVLRAFEVLEAGGAAGQRFDLVHDHSGFAAFALADRLPVPMLHTIHGPFTPDITAFYRRHASKAWVSGLSRAQLAAKPANLRSVGPIPNPIDVSTWPFEARKQRHLLWIGRMTEEKGAHRAIAVARAAGRPLVLAGPVQPGQEDFFRREIEPHIDGLRVSFVGEVGGRDKQRLFAGAAALLMPIRWPEPFGMVMIEAMACGTPVLAFPEGSAAEIVRHGVSGFLTRDEAAMAAAVSSLDELDPAACRAWVAEHFDTGAVAAAYETAYRTVVSPPSGRPLRSVNA